MEILLNFLVYIELNVENNYILTFLFFFIFLIFYNSFSIPGNIVFMASAGYFFGTYIGYVISISALVFGSLIFFSFSHYFIKIIFPQLIDKYTFNLQNYISDSSMEYLIIFRIIPGPPLFLQNLLLSFLNINKINFIISTFVGLSPIAFVSVFIGNQLKDIDNIKNLSLIDIFSFKFLLFIFCLLIFLLIKIFYNKK